MVATLACWQYHAWRRKYDGKKVYEAKKSFQKLRGLIMIDIHVIWCLFDPWIRAPGWIKNQDPDP
jgi:hypothetical protein